MQEELIRLYSRVTSENTRLMYTMYNDFLSRARENERMLSNLILYDIGNTRTQPLTRSNETPNIIPDTSEENSIQNRQNIPNIPSIPNTNRDTNNQNMIRNMRRYYSNSNTNNYRNQLRNNIRNEVNSTNRTNNYRHGNIIRNNANVSFYDMPQTNNSINTVLNTFDNLITTSLDDLLEPVVVRPTQQQIQVSTQRLIFSDIIRPVNSRCPISLTEFDSNSETIMISYCRHLFCPNEILNWFRSNVRCPVCRYDIREYSRPMYSHRSATSNHIESNLNERENTEYIEENTSDNEEDTSDNEENTSDNEEDNNSVQISEESEILPDGEMNNLLNSSLTDALFNDIYNEISESDNNEN